MTFKFFGKQLKMLQKTCLNSLQNKYIISKRKTLLSTFFSTCFIPSKASNINKIKVCKVIIKTNGTYQKKKVKKKKGSVECGTACFSGWCWLGCGWCGRRGGRVEERSNFLSSFRCFLMELLYTNTTVPVCRCQVFRPAPNSHRI